MTLHPSTLFQLSHSCYNTIFDRIGGATAATPAAKQVRRESQRLKKASAAVCIHCIRAIQKSPIFRAFLCFSRRCILSFSSPPVMKNGLQASLFLAATI